MSLRDEAHLSPQERAALAQLEALAQADDPRLAAQLGGQRAIWRGRWPWQPPRIQPRGWWGPALALVGLVITVSSLAVPFGLFLGTAGALMAAAGLDLCTRWLKLRLQTESPPAAGTWGPPTATSR